MSLPISTRAVIPPNLCLCLRTRWLSLASVMRLTVFAQSLPSRTGGSGTCVLAGKRPCWSSLATLTSLTATRTCSGLANTCSLPTSSSPRPALTSSPRRRTSRLDARSAATSTAGSLATSPSSWTRWSTTPTPCAGEVKVVYPTAMCGHCAADGRAMMTSLVALTAGDNLDKYGMLGGKSHDIYCPRPTCGSSMAPSATPSTLAASRAPSRSMMAAAAAPPGRAMMNDCFDLWMGADFIKHDGRPGNRASP
mmetsp:Transcript_115040/g.358253  ORF Transcript_115040/g.358253 Transcript_115040/m.358253 type:complete len:251 (+) Transcript_115040:397-1149(+)